MMEQTGLYTQKEILDKARELAAMIAQTKEVDFYKRAELRSSTMSACKI